MGTLLFPKESLPARSVSTPPEQFRPRWRLIWVACCADVFLSKADSYTKDDGNALTGVAVIDVAEVPIKV